MKTYLLIYILLSLTLLSCSSIKVKNLTNNGSIVKEIENVEIIAQNENINHKGVRIGDFVLKENPKPLGSFDIDWNKIKKKMKDLAISSGANLIEVDRIGFGIKGHVFYVDGSFFYAENLKSNKKENESCSLVVFRDGLESVLGSAFKINVKIDSTEFKKIKKGNYAKSKFDNCSKNVSLVINKSSHNIKLNGESKYFKVSKQTSGNSTNGGVQIALGGTLLVEIVDKDLGKLMMFQN